MRKLIAYLAAMCGRAEQATVAEIMKPITSIHDRLEKRRQDAFVAADAADIAARVWEGQRQEHTAVAIEAAQAQAKLSALLP